MGTNKAKCPIHKDNPKRAIAKAKRGFGSNVMGKLDIDQDAWSQRFDPLFKVKGKERHKQSIERVYV